VSIQLDCCIETFYHFGDNDRERWDSLFSLYQLPPYQLPNQEPVLSFGLAGRAPLLRSANFYTSNFLHNVALHALLIILLPGQALRQYTLGLGLLVKDNELNFCDEV
jgi:hypothetical protein